ncbi:MAG: FHA domain-containing protein [Kiritimatiellae bacterium]|nr:FHA domain-containing protein [Kiritimatiellia bacterium]
MAKRPEITVLTGELSGKRFAVPDGGLKLGRSSSNDVHIPDEELSRNHCLFEPDGDDAIRVIDLASANGTFVNGEQLGSSARTLKPGDRIEAGSTLFAVVGADEQIPPPLATAKPATGGPVDLGLGTAAGAENESVQAPLAPSAAKRQKLLNLLWAGAATALVTAIFLLLTSNPTVGKAPSGADAGRAAPQPEPEVAFEYERVDLSTNKVERYFAALDGGKLKLEFAAQLADGSGKQGFSESKDIGSEAKRIFAKLFDTQAWREAKSRTDASAAELNRLQSWRLKVSYGGESRDILFSNAAGKMPADFRRLCRELELDVNSELDATTILRSAAASLGESAEKERIADDLYSKRDYRRGNLWESIKRYREAARVLDGLQDCIDEQVRIRTKLESALEELDRRYDILKGKASLADQQKDYDTALEAYREIRELIPSEVDPRCEDAMRRQREIEAELDAVKKGGRK